MRAKVRLEGEGGDEGESAAAYSRFPVGPPLRSLSVASSAAQNADAVMVGWGHASENPKLGDLLTAKSAELGRDITFVGP